MPLSYRVHTGGKRKKDFDTLESAQRFCNEVFEHTKIVLSIVRAVTPLPDAQKTDKMRVVRFRPYRKGMGPTFTLNMYYLGSTKVGYEFRMRENGISALLFSGDDFRPSPIDAADSDEAVKALMCFLTLRPGDTDREYFANYTPEQMEYCQTHGETLSAEVFYRFGE